MVEVAPLADLRRDTYAKHLMRMGMDTSPAAHWSVGLARALTGGLGGYLAAEEEQASTKGMQDYAKALLALRGVGGAPAAAGTVAPASTGPAGGPSPETGAPLPGDLDKVVRTVYGEARGEGEQGQRAVAAVIGNRAQQSGMSVPDVVMARGQFEPWQNPATRAELEGLDPKSAAYQKIAAAIAPVMSGTAPDPTGGATHFYAPRAQAALGRPAPKWDDGTGTDLGNHRFFNHGYQPSPQQIAAALMPAAGGAQPQPAAQPAASPAASSDAQAQLMRVLANPNIPAAAKAQLLNQAMPNYGFQSVGENLVRTDPRTGQATVVPGLSPAKPTYGVIGQDQFGNPQYGWIDPAKRSVSPGPYGTASQQSGAGTGPGPGGPGTGNASGAVPPAPPGADPKEWRALATKNMAENTLAPKPQDVAELRKEVMQLPSYTNYKSAVPIYKSMADTAGRDSRASDLNLVYGLGKIMDPTSVVREGEMIMVKNTASLPDWVVGNINAINGGAALTPQTRQAILEEAHSRMRAYEDEYHLDTSHYRGVATRNRMNVDDVVPTFEPTKKWERARTDTAPAAPTGRIRDYNPATGRIE
jgi:hypothetical protein